MGLLDGTLVTHEDLSTELERYSELSDKVRAGKSSAAERNELRTMRKRLSVS
jgi:hypothetical protein